MASINPYLKIGHKKLGFGSSTEIQGDTFQRAVKKFPDFSCNGEEYDNTPDGIKAFYDVKKERHNKRMMKYGLCKTHNEPRKVSKAEYKAILDVQYEQDKYSLVQKKLKKHLPLSDSEEKFLSFIISQMKPAENSRVLWRAVGVYDGFEEQIRNGVLKFDCLTSTNSNYDDFFDYWYPKSYVEKNDRLYIKEGYMLKINVPRGIKLLDCNAICKKKYTRMNSEVVLPPSKWKVDSIDDDLKVIELSPLKDSI